MQVYRQLAQWSRNYRQVQDEDMRNSYEEWITKLVREYLPYGSGVDSGVTLDLNASSADRLVFWSSFHMMNDNGFYMGWWDFKVIVTPSMVLDFEIRVTSKQKDKRLLRPYITELFSDSLSQVVTDGFYERVHKEMKEALAKKEGA